MKFQICRHLYRQAFPSGEVQVIREALNIGRAGEVFTRHLFDWQITPAEAVIAYLEDDFQGVFERRDLIVSSAGEAVHRDLGARHPHDFHASDPGIGLTAADLDAQYDGARGRFEHLAQRFRNLLRRPGDFLYVLNRWPDAAMAARIVAALSRGGPQHRPTLLCVEVAGRADDPAGPSVASATLPAAIDKPDALAWEGDDAAWDEVFAAHPIRHDGEAFTAGLRAAGDRPPPACRALDLHWRDLAEPGPPRPGPFTATVPTTPWGYGAASDAIHLAETAAGRTILMGVEVMSGRVSVALIPPDGSRILGRDQTLSHGEGPVIIRLLVPAQETTVHILIRNAGDGGGQATVLWTGFPSDPAEA